MENILKIKLWNEDIAVLFWNKDKDYGVIEFLDSFVQKKINLSPLQIPLENLLRGEKIYSFPELKGKTFKGLPGLIADSLPDDYGNNVIDEWFLSKKIPIDINPVVRLCYIGKRGMGALEFEPAIKDDQLDESSKIEISELVDLASTVLNQRTQFQIDINHPNINISDILKVGTSAGGAKPKAIIALNEITGEVRSGQVKAPEGFTYWILKFDGVEGGKIICGLAHFDRDDRYSYEQLFKTMRQLYLSYPDFEQMYRRMVFNVLARNHDDHTKNHSFIMDNSGEWSLAPAYDLCYS